MEYTKKYLDAIELSIADGPLKTLPYLEGFSGAKLLGALQRSVESAPVGTIYLEIGVYQGLSLVSVASANTNTPCYGIDNFAFFDPLNKNKSIVLERKDKAEASNVQLIDLDYEDAMESLSEYIGDQKIGVFFVDGPHDYRSQLMCLELAKPYLHENAIIFVDDSNYAHVRQANRDFLYNNKEYKLLFESYTPKHPDNMNEEEIVKARNGWWDGINIIVKDAENHIPYSEPITERNRQLYENDHIVHSMRGATYAPLATEMLSFIYPFKPLALLKRIFRLRWEMKQKNRTVSVQYRKLNQYIDKEIERFNRPH